MEQTIKKVRLYEQVAEKVKEAILSGEYQAGNNLPPEGILANRFQVSRTAVREAMIVLQEMGLISISPGRGTLVLRNTEPSMEENLYELLKKEDIIELVELRQGIEIEAVALAARRCTPEDLAELRAIFNSLKEEVVQQKIGTDQDYKFHLKIIEMTKNHLYLNIMTAISERLYEALREARIHTRKKEGGPEEVLAEHEIILNEISKKDEKKASAAMKLHLEKAYARLMEVFGTKCDADRINLMVEEVKSE